MPVSVVFRGDWALATRVLSILQRRTKGAVAQTMTVEGQRLARMIRSGVTAQKRTAFKELSPWTRAKRWVKGNYSSAKLMDTRAMIESVGSRKLSWDTVFVGILLGAKSRNGVPLALIGTKHEFGAKIVLPVTDAMRKYIRMLFAKLPWLKPALDAANVPSKGMFTRPFIVIDIPARPFMTPAYEKFMIGAPERFRARMEHELFAGFALKKR